MGQCYAKRRMTNFDCLYSKVENIIIHNNIVELEFISRTEEFKMCFLKINQPVYKTPEYKCDLLALCAFYSAVDCFKFVHKGLSSSLDLSDTQLQDQGSSLIDIICLKGSTELLSYYLPLYSPKLKSSIQEDMTLSLNFGDDSQEKPVKAAPSIYTPIQKACEEGHITIISFVQKFYQYRLPPYQLDINYQSDSTGENCALIACRRANFTTIKFLHQNCKANFSPLNKKGENAIQILSATQQNYNVRDFYEIFTYLVKQVNVDILYNFEETLLLIKCEKTTKFFEKKLKQRGIEVKKKVLEEENQIVKVETERNDLEVKIDRFVGQDIDFCILYGEVMDRDEEISVISDQRDISFSSFIEA